MPARRASSRRRPRPNTTLTNTASVRAAADTADQDPTIDWDDRIVFVTVGSTRFDALVRAVAAPRCLRALHACGFSRVVFQIGTGSYVPAARGHGGEDGERGSSLLPMSYFRRAPTIEPCLRKAALVISHAGVGTLMETLRLRRPLIAVANPDLMDNHQVEVGAALEQKRCLQLCRSPDGVCDAVDALAKSERVPYPDRETTLFPALLEEELAASAAAAHTAGFGWPLAGWLLACGLVWAAVGG